MNNSNDYVSVNDILADVQMAVGDPEIKRGVTRGFYVRQIANALEELALDTYFQVLTQDFPYPESNILPLPTNCFNPREIYLYNGVCGEPESVNKVYFERNFNNTGGGYSYTRKRMQNMNTDPYLPKTTHTRYDIYGANIQNGDIMFTNECSAFSYVRLVFNGFGGDIGVVPVIPRELRTAVKDYVRVQILTVFTAFDKTNLPLLQMAQMDLNGNGRNTGSWQKARRRVASMGTWQKNDYREYLSRMNY